MANKEVPEHIKNFEDLKKKAKKILDTTRLHHTDAYVRAADSVLKDEKTGQIDYDLLDKTETQDRFVGKMTDYYVERANEYFGSKISVDDRYKVDQLLNAYAGVTRTELLEAVRTHGKKYTIESHEKNREELLKKVGKQLNQAAAADLTDKHVKDFIEHMGLEDIIDASKVRITDMALLHDLWQTYGTLSHKIIKNFYQEQLGVPSPVYLKKEKKKAA